MTDSSHPSATRHVVDPWLRVLVPLAASIVVAGFPASLWFQQQSPPTAMPWSVIAGSCGFAAVVLLLVLRFDRRVLRIAHHVERALPSRFHRALLVGLALRIVVPLVVRAMPSSDGAVYFQLARQMAAGSGYRMAGSVAYWPPGLPLLLTPLVALLGDAFVVSMVFGLLSYVVGAFGTWRLARAVGLRRNAVTPVWLLACWPTLILCTGLPEKELLVTALLPWAVLCGLRMAGGSIGAALAGGVLLGAVTLTQPSFQLLAVVPFAFTPWVAGSRSRYVLRCVGFVAAMASTLAPWVYRNHVALGSAVIATNGGGNLYRANNELATGGYTQVGRVDLDVLDELASDRVGKQLTVEWIRRDPARFVQLMAGKMLLFAGDDSYGAFRALRAGQPGDDTPARARFYKVAKLVSAVPWLLLWIVAAAAARRRADGVSRRLTAGLVVFLPYLYLSGIHALFESGGKYHLPALTCLLVGLAWLTTARSDPDDASP